MDVWSFALGVSVVILVIGLLMRWLWREREFSGLIATLGLMLALISIMLVLTSALFGDQADRLEVRVFNQMRDPAHVVITVNGTEVSDTNLDPPQWFNGDNNRHLFLHSNDIGNEAGVITVRVNNGTATTLSGLWGLGDSITIIINADGTITLKDDNLNSEGK